MEDWPPSHILSGRTLPWCVKETCQRISPHPKPKQSHYMGGANSAAALAASRPKPKIILAPSQHAKVSPCGYTGQHPQSCRLSREVCNLTLEHLAGRNAAAAAPTLPVRLLLKQKGSVWYLQMSMSWLCWSETQCGSTHSSPKQPLVPSITPVETHFKEVCGAETITEMCPWIWFTSISCGSAFQKHT